MVLPLPRVRVPGQRLHSPDGERWPRFWKERLHILAIEYRCICEIAGVEFPIASGYRSLTSQADLFFVSNSAHSRGQALDLFPVDGWTIREMATVAEQRREEPDSRLMGIGLMPEWLHLDIRPRRKRITWRVTSAERID